MHARPSASYVTTQCIRLPLACSAAMWRASSHTSCRSVTRSARNRRELAARLRPSSRSASALPSVQTIRRAARDAATAASPAAPQPSSRTCFPIIDTVPNFSAGRITVSDDHPDAKRCRSISPASSSDCCKSQSWAWVLRISCGASKLTPYIGRRPGTAAAAAPGAAPPATP